LRSRNDHSSVVGNNFDNGHGARIALLAAIPNPRGAVLPKFRILVVDDFLPWHRTVARILHSTLNFQIVGFAQNGLEALPMMLELQPDVVLLDVDMPILSGIETAREMVRLAPDIRIIFLAVDDSPWLMQEALQAGAVHYVSKYHASFELLPAIEEATKSLI
jgi:NarL family two-component system response regulator YdfI